MDGLLLLFEGSTRCAFKQTSPVQQKTSTDVILQSLEPLIIKFPLTGGEGLLSFLTLEYLVK
jgi:hypothetical protein